MTLGTARIIQGDATHLPLEDESVDLCVTSPPYFGLRSYTDGGAHYDGQLGDEPTPREYVDNLITATREMIRVLKPTGSIWVNLGDKYAGSNGASGGNASTLDGGAVNARPRDAKHTNARGGFVAGGAPAKSLIGIPWRYALRAIDDLGLILRAEIIWSKPNGLPESVTDRVRRSHETWFHFTKSPRYYSAIDHIREPTGDYTGKTYAERLTAGEPPRPHQGTAKRKGPTEFTANPLGKLPGSVWEIPTQPLTVPDWLGVDHYAAFPIEWPRRIIAGWSPPGICTACGQGRRPVLQSERTFDGEPVGQGTGSIFGAERTQTRNKGVGNWRFGVERNLTGYACDCPTPTAPTTPATVLDPFGGTGTTALAAKAQGRHGITLDMSADYCRIATWRCSDPRELASAMQVDKPAVQHDGQLDLLEGFFA